MFPLSIFLGKLLGLYCIILALTMMARKQSAIATMNALIKNPPLLRADRRFTSSAGRNLWMIDQHHIVRVPIESTDVPRINRSD
jgi:hypothetical protein